MSGRRYAGVAAKVLLVLAGIAAIPFLVAVTFYPVGVRQTYVLPVEVQGSVQFCAHWNTSFRRPSYELVAPAICGKDKYAVQLAVAQADVKSMQALIAKRKVWLSVYDRIVGTEISWPTWVAGK